MYDVAEGIVTLATFFIRFSKLFHTEFAICFVKIFQHCFD